MSKSLGNGIDPIEMIDAYGADALRMNMVSGISPGNDMRFMIPKCESYRNFANKIWNASRFVLMNLTIEKNELPETLELEDKWILSKLNNVTREITENLDKFELGIAAGKIYDFIWDTFCDWYIELAKTRLSSDNEQSKLGAQKVLCWVLTEILKLLHPFMPFITEEIWQALPHDGDALMVQSWPVYREEFNFADEEKEMEAVMEAIRSVRALRAEKNVPPSRKTKLIIASDKTDVFESGKAFLMRLAYASEVEISAESPKDISDMLTAITKDARIFIPMAELLDVKEELKRIEKELKKARDDLSRIQGKLANPNFTQKAPEAVVTAEREKAEKLQALLSNLEESEKHLKSMA